MGAACPTRAPNQLLMRFATPSGWLTQADTLIESTATAKPGVTMARCTANFVAKLHGPAPPAPACSQVTARPLRALQGLPGLCRSGHRTTGCTHPLDGEPTRLGLAPHVRALYTGAPCTWVRAGGQLDSPGAGLHAHAHARPAHHELHADLGDADLADDCAASSRAVPQHAQLMHAARPGPPAVRAAVRAQWIGGACGAQGADSHTPHVFNKAWPASAQGACGRPFTSGDPHARRSREALKGCKRRPMHSVAWAHQAAAHLACGRGGGRRRRCRGRPGALGGRGVLGPAVLGAWAAAVHARHALLRGHAISARLLRAQGAADALTGLAQAC